jgi:hypothetical protein
MAAVLVGDATSRREEVRLRLTLWQRSVPFSPVLLGAVAQLIIHLTQPPTPAAYALTPAEHHQVVLFNAIAIPVAVVLAILVMLQTRWFGTTLTPSAAHVHNLRRRTILWSDVRAVTTQTVFGSRVVVLHEENRSARLRAQITGFLIRDRHFEEKYHAVGQWWLDHR